MKLCCKRLFLTSHLLLFCLFNLSPAYAQTLSDTLTEFQINSSKPANLPHEEKLNHFSTGQKLIIFDSAVLERYQMQQLSALLSQQSNVFIKSYGPSGLATMNIRGSSAAQTSVIWNGVPINNAALGLTDVSLLPVSFSEHIYLLYGSSSSLWGSANVGGAVVLETAQPSFGKRSAYGISAAAGSYGQYDFSARLDLAGKKWNFRTHYLQQAAKNDFPYRNDAGTTERMQNSALSGFVIQQEASFKLNEKNRIRVIGWYQHYDREIPPALFESQSEKTKEEKSLRLLLDWKGEIAASPAYLKISWIDDKMNFSDPRSRQHFENGVQQYFAEAGWKRKFGIRHEMLFFAPVEMAKANARVKQKQQLRWAAAAAYRYQSISQNLTISASVRGQYTDQHEILLPGISAVFRSGKSLSFSGSFQRTFRAPTLNEMYFEPGGNAALRPEQGWSSELGTCWEGSSHRFKFKQELTAFHRYIDDWILWLGGAVWTPHNIASVRSYGVEYAGFTDYSFSRGKLHLSALVSFTKSVTVASYLANDRSVGRQIPYTPIVSAQLNTGCTVGRFYVNINQTFTGDRYVNMDETDRVPAFALTSAQCTYHQPIGNNRFFTSLQCNNIFNQGYQIINGRPMPGINWMLAVQWRGLF